MTPETPYPWAERLDCAVTVCDTQGVVIYQNVRSREVNGDVRGRSLIPCHKDRSQQLIRRLLCEGGKNVYTIQKGGVRKLIYQTVWRHGEALQADEERGSSDTTGPTTTGPCDGRIGGLVEFSFEIPEEMPHRIRE